MIFSLYLAISVQRNFYDDGNVLSALVKVAGSYITREHLNMISATEELNV